MNTTTQGRFVPLNLGPGEVVPVIGEGRNFHVVFSPVEIEIKWPGGEFSAFPQGLGISDLPDGATFSRLEVKNPSAGYITVRLYIGGASLTDSRADVMEPKTVAVGQPAATLAGSGNLNLDGIPTGLRLRRKCVQVTNLDANLNLQLRDVSGNVVLSVFPQTSITLPISEFVQVHNPNGSPLALNVSEIWWTL